MNTLCEKIHTFLCEFSDSTLLVSLNACHEEKCFWTKIKHHVIYSSHCTQPKLHVFRDNDTKLRRSVQDCYIVLVFSKFFFNKNFERVLCFCQSRQKVTLVILSCFVCRQREVETVGLKQVFWLPLPRDATKSVGILSLACQLLSASNIGDGDKGMFSECQKYTQPILGKYFNNDNIK